MPQQKIAHKDKVWMPTPVQQKLRDKTITAKKWAEMVKPGDWINRGGPGSDTLPTMEALSARLADGSLKNIEIWNQAIMLHHSFAETSGVSAQGWQSHEQDCGSRNSIEKSIHERRVLPAAYLSLPFSI